MNAREFFDVFFTYVVPLLLTWAAVDFWRRTPKSRGDWLRVIVATAAALLSLWRTVDILTGT